MNHNGEAETVRIYLRPKPKLKKTQLEYDFSTLGIKGKASRGNLVSKNSIQKIVMKSKGVSTIGGKDIWYDADVQRLNEDGRGIHLGEFSGEDRVLAIFKDGTYYTTNYETVNKYQGEVLRIEKLDIGKTWTALYWDAGAKAFYIKRFSFTESNNSPVSFIAEGRNSYLVDIADDLHPQVLVTFGGKYAHREPEIIDAEEYIAKKGLTAKGKKCHAYDLSKVEFTEPLHKPEDDVEPQEEEVIDIDIDVTEEDDTPAATPSAGSGPAPIEQTGQAGKLLEENPDDDDVEPIELTLF